MNVIHNVYMKYLLKLALSQDNIERLPNFFFKLLHSLLSLIHARGGDGEAKGYKQVITIFIKKPRDVYRSLLQEVRTFSSPSACNN